MSAARATTGLLQGRARRVAVVGLSVVFASGIAVSAIGQRRAQTRGEAAAASHAQLLAGSVLAPALTPADVARPVNGPREQKLDALVTNRILSAGAVAVTIVRPDGTVVFSTNEALAGRKFPAERSHLRPVLAGASQSRVADDPSGSGQVYETFVSLRPGGSGPVPAVAEIVQDYAPILAAASRPWQTLEIGFAIALLLCLIGIPLAFRPPAPRAGNSDWLPKAGGLDDDGPPVEGRLRQIAEQARQADAAYRTVSEQLKKSDEKLQDTGAALQSALEQSRSAEERAKAASQRLQSTESALKAARERLGQLDERVRKAEAATVIAKERSLEAGVDADLDERPGSVEEELRRAREQLRETEAARRSLIDQARKAEQRAARAEADALAALAEQAGTAEDRDAGADARVGELEGRLAELDGRLAGAERERERLESEDARLEAERERQEAELSQARQRLRDVTEELQEAVAERGSLAEELRRAQGDLAQIDTVNRALAEQARIAEQRAADAHEQAQRTEGEGAEARAAELEGRLGVSDAERARLEAELALARERLREADERAELSETAYQSVAEELRDLQRRPDPTERLRTVEDRARTAEESLELMQARLDEAQALVRRLEEEAIELGSRTPEPSEERTELEDVLRVTQERLAGSTEHLLQMEERTRQAERELKRLQGEREADEERHRRSKMEEALRTLAGNARGPDPAPAVEDRRASAPFLAALSLEARNALASIQGVALTLKHKQSSAEQQPLLRQLNAHTRKLNNIVADLLDADRVARGAVQLNRRRTDVDALVRRAVGEWGVGDDRTVEVRSERIVVPVDPIRVEQMVGALLANSVNRTRPGSTLSVVVRSADGGVIVAVEDEEPASDAAMSPVVERFADMHGGWARVESRTGGGSSFRVFLPESEAPRAEDPPLGEQSDDAPEIVVADLTEAESLTEAPDLPATTPKT